MPTILLLPCFDMRCGYFAAFFPTSEADRTSAFLPHLWVMSSSHFSLFDASSKKAFFSPPNTKMWLLQILSSSSSFFDFLIIFVTNLQRVKYSSFFKRLQMNKKKIVLIWGVLMLILKVDPSGFWTSFTYKSNNGKNNKYNWSKKNPVFSQKLHILQLYWKMS